MLLVQKPVDEHGVRHVDSALVENLQTWWYETAMGHVDETIAKLEIPWEDLSLASEDVLETELVELSVKLARISSYMVRVNNLLAVATARHYAAKEALEQAVNRRLANDELQAQGGKLPAIALRTAAVISRQKPFRNAKIDSIETGALIRALEQVKDALDVLWRTASRIMSARIKEPID